jgi:uncharacterized membrane protein YidH (DUF202 family)
MSSDVPPMSHRTQLTLHSLLAVFLLVLCVVVVDVAAWHFAATQGIKGKRLDHWMLWATAIGTVIGFVVFFSYQTWILPKRLRGLHPPPTAEQVERERQHQENLARIDREKEALREQLRATPGLERYAERIGRSTIRSVEDARVLEARVAQLRADPVKARYAERVFEGEAITDRMIEYWESPAERLLCAHFGTLETDIRKADPRAYPEDERTLRAWLGFDFDVLKQRYGLGPPITFWRREFGPQFHGRGEDNYDGLERIECPEHGCGLHGSLHWPKFPAA